MRQKRKPEPDEEPQEQPQRKAAAKPRRSLVAEAGAKPREGRLATCFAASTLRGSRQNTLQPHT